MGGEDDDGAMQAPDPLSMAWLEMSDLGNAERLKQLARDKLLHVRGLGWIAYDDVRWSAEDGERLASLLAHDVARHIRTEVQALADADDKALPAWCTKDVRASRIAELHKWGVASGNAHKTKAMLDQAAHLLAAEPDSFDVDPLAINMLNGTLRAWRNDLSEWRVRLDRHDPRDRLTRVTACSWDPAAECPLWQAHMETVLPDPDVRRFFQEVIGYAATGRVEEQLMFLLQGKGGDGKSTTMNALRDVLGGYGATADVKSFMSGAERSGAEASPDFARLSGDVRLVSTGEPKPGGALDEAKVKQATGGGKIPARRLHGDIFEYQPRWKLFLECNRKPRITGDDDGIWRRIIVILFPHQFKGRREDKQMPARLMAEAPGIMRWVIDGMLAWLARGRLDPPKQVIDAVEDYRRAANPFGEWMAERVDTSDPLVLTLSTELWKDYVAWCERNEVSDREKMTQTRFGVALGDRQILNGPKDRQGRKRRRGAKLRPEGGGLGLGGEDDDLP